MNQQTGPPINNPVYNDIVNKAENIIQEDKNRQDKINKQLLENKKNTNILQNILTKSANPSPTYLVLLIIFALVILWILHCVLIKPKLTGEWYPDAGSDVWYLQHKLMSNQVSVNINGKNKGYLEAVDNLIIYNNTVGIWNYKNTIIFTNGLTLTRSLN